MSTVKEEAKRLIRRLSTPEKILLVEDLWESITLEDSAVPLPASHIKELDKRLKKFAASPGKILSLEELRSRIDKRK